MIERMQAGRITGIYQDELIVVRNGVRIGKVVYPARRNLIVSTASTLIGALLGGVAGYGGALYWANGSGDVSWDAATPAETDVAQLVNEFARVAVTTSFLDEAFVEVPGPTHIVKVAATFGAGVSVGTLRTWGVFGGNATAALNSGLLIDTLNHARIDKGDQDVLNRTVIFII